MAKSDPEKRLTDAALKLLAKTPWADLSLTAMAKAARVPMKEMFTLAPSREAVVGLLLKRFGAAVAESHTPEASEDLRSRMFDVAMAWFDVLAPHRKAIRSLSDGLKRDPFALIALRSDAVAASQWLLALAGADKGPLSAAKSIGFAIILARAVPVWVEDGEDLSKTMAQIDRDLSRAEGWLSPRQSGSQEA